MKIIKEFMLMLEQRLTAWEHLINLLFREEFLAAERAALPEDAGGRELQLCCCKLFHIPPFRLFCRFSFSSRPWGLLQ